MTDVAIVLFSIALMVFLLFRLLRRQRPAQAPAPVEEPASRPNLMEVYRQAANMADFFNMTANPEDVLVAAEFQTGSKLLGHPSITPAELLRHASGDNVIVASMALVALTERRDLPDLRADVLRLFRECAVWSGYFGLGFLAKHVPPQESIIGPVLTSIGSHWKGRVPRRVLREFILARLDGGEPAGFDESTDLIDDHREFLLSFLNEIRDERLEKLVTHLQGGGAPTPASSSEVPFGSGAEERNTELASIGRIWSLEADVREPAVEHASLAHDVQHLEAAFRRAGPRSVLLVGEAGVGKTMLVRTLARRLMQSGWTIFEASEAQLIAGQRYIGDFEQRVRSLMANLTRRKKVLWYIPQFHQLLWTGRHEHQPRGFLEILLPILEERRVLVLGETRVDEYERLVRSQPRVPVALDVQRIEPLDAATSLEVARERTRRRASKKGEPLAEGTLQEAWDLAQQFLAEQAAPGNLLSLLDLTEKRLAVTGVLTQRAIEPFDLITTLSRVTGLPENILDDRLRLDLVGLRRQFEERILGQPEAIDCLVERVAMIKAGLTDPTRPLGVFMFAGPTGTGKTEIAKTLAEFLFGSPERLVRIDMSELQTADALERLVGSTRGNDTPLVDEVRKQPFCVVLLDEFEKAHPRVWDLFLQVFSDGRLTDRRGDTANFRHAIVIMTSNLGGAVPSGTTLGFVSTHARYRPGLAQRTLETSFSKEFLNRIDRIVMFKPLDRETMRRILRKELDDVMRRRGLRNREWAIEWEEDAIEFLLAKGFTADLGARPLKRAIDRYVLSPFATSIVMNQVPEGDQFLFVRAEGERLVAEFVDPDAPHATLAAAAAPRAGEVRPLESIAFDPRGTATDLACLQAHHARLVERVEGEAWKVAKEDAMALMSREGFWQTPNRFAVLGEIEYFDRIERSVHGAGSLLERLLGNSPQGRERYSADLIGHLAERLYLLDAACAGIDRNAPREAFLLVESSEAEADPFAVQLGSMYRSWGRKRGMEVVTLEESDGTPPYRLLLAVSGFAAFGILQVETGLHVFEVARPNGGVERHKVRVQAVGQPPEPAGSNSDDLRRQALAAFEADGPQRPVIVRRYSESPQLVRDSVRGWRSGKLARILDGDFDLVPGDRVEE